VLAHRRLLAFLLTATAVAVGLGAARPAPPATLTMAVAARDLPAGTVLTRDDLTSVEVSPGGVPDEVLAHPLGAMLAAPVRRGEPVTDVRVVGPGITTGHPELTAVPVRLPDADMAALLHTGDRIDLYATDPASGRTTLVTTDALVLGLPASGAGEGSSSTNTGDNGVTNLLGGRLVIVGVAASSVEPVTSAGVGGFLTFAY